MTGCSTTCWDQSQTSERELLPAEGHQGVWPIRWPETRNQPIRWPETRNQSVLTDDRLKTNLMLINCRNSETEFKVYKTLKPERHTHTHTHKQSNSPTTPTRHSSFCLHPSHILLIHADHWTALTPLTQHPRYKNQALRTGSLRKFYCL